jgi:hypothetical protein
MRHFITVFGILCITACAGVNTKSKPDVDYVRNFTIDCSKAHEQYQYIDSLTPTAWERQSAKILNSSVTASIGGAMSGDYWNRKHISSGAYEANISMIKHDIRSQCGYKDYK